MSATGDQPHRGGRSTGRHSRYSSIWYETINFKCVLTYLVVSALLVMNVGPCCRTTTQLEGTGRLCRGAACGEQSKRCWRGHGMPRG